MTPTQVAVVGGPDRMSIAEVAAIAQAVLNTEVSANRFDPADWAANQRASLDPRVRDWLLSMFDYYDHYGLVVGSLPLEAILGRTPTGIKAALQRELGAG